MNQIIDAVLADRGVITAADHPRLQSTLKRLVRQGVLVRPLPGTYVSAHDTSRGAWLRAVCAWSAPCGVLHGATAAEPWLPVTSALPTTRENTELAHPTLRSRGRIEVARRLVPLAQYLADRERLNVLAAHGYLVLRFGWHHLDQPDYIARAVRLALRTAERGLGAHV